MSSFLRLHTNASCLRRLDNTYDIHGVFCRPEGVSSDVVQLLVHGITYTSQYWSPPSEEFRNYSCAAFSRERGLPSLAIDWLGVGLSSRPPNAVDVQYPSVSAAISQIARLLKNTSFLPGTLPFKKVFGVGHSAGSRLLNFGAIVEGPQSPLDGLVLTVSLILEPSALGPIPSLLPPARDVDPERWATLDPSYVSTANRTIFYSPDSNSFSPRTFAFDNVTKDVGTVSVLAQTPTTSLPNAYTGHVVKIVGPEDFFCTGAGNNKCDDVAALREVEQVLWPDAKSFDVVVAEGSGHDLNLDFRALGPFTFVAFVEQFSRS